MTKLDSLRKVIREEVRAVFQEELAGILKEVILNKGNGGQLTEAVKPAKPKVPGTLNTLAPKPPVAPILSPGNPLNSLLQETAMSMTSKDYEGLNGTQVIAADVPIVESVNDMFASSRASSNLDAIEINAVPDFSAIMNKMKMNGEI